jgi:hypothetical protein
VLSDRWNMKIVAPLVLALSLCALTTQGFAAPFLVSGATAQHNVAELTSEIPWCTSLQQAQYVAQQQGKMIFWMHMLGSLSGAT